MEDAVSLLCSHFIWIRSGMEGAASSVSEGYYGWEVSQSLSNHRLGLILSSIRTHMHKTKVDRNTNNTGTAGKFVDTQKIRTDITTNNDDDMNLVSEDSACPNCSIG